MVSGFTEEYDVVMVGGGHAGCEAAKAPHHAGWAKPAAACFALPKLCGCAGGKNESNSSDKPDSALGTKRPS